MGNRRVPLRAEAIGLVGAVAVAALAAWPLFRGGTLLGLDSAIQFYPMYSFLGEELREGRLPVWNPYLFGGSPAIGNPQSGWMYGLAMLAFTLLPLAPAIVAFVVVHLLLTSLGTYALARVLGLGLWGAVTASAAHQLSGYLALSSACCPVHLYVAAWVPLALVGAELAIRARSWAARAGWWVLAGFSLAQAFAGWIGQGGYYAFLTAGGFIAYRTLFHPPTDAEPRSARVRLRGLLMHGGAIGCIALALVAAALMPALEYVGISSLANGYPSTDFEDGWRNLSDLAQRLLGRTSYHAGAAMLALAAVGLVAGWRRPATPFFALLVAASLYFAQNDRTPVHAVVYAVLPRFEELQEHRPDRILMVGYLGIAMLAGAAVDAVPRLDRRAVGLALVPIAGLLLLAVLLDDGARYIGAYTLVPILAVGAMFAAALVPLAPVRSAVPALLLLVLVIDQRAAIRDIFARQPESAIARVDLGSFYDLPPAAAFLRETQEAGPFRYVGYDAGLQQGRNQTLYRYQFADERTARLIVNNRGAIHRLQDLQGANDPIHVARFDDFVAAINGFRQEYHDAHVYPSGLDSPLLEVFNVRYAVVPAAVPPGRPDLLHLGQRWPTVYADADVRVLSNAAALPRAWLVHEARQVEPGGALPLLAGGEVDPRRTALLEESPPPLALLPPGADEEATIVRFDPDRVVVRVRTASDALLMFGEIAYPAWRATVDGQPVRLYTADHALRAVPVPAGEHTVEIRYESRPLLVGLVVSTMTYIGLAVVLAVLAWRRLGILRSSHAHRDTVPGELPPPLPAD